MKFLVFFNYSLISRMIRLRMMDMKSPMLSLQRSLQLNRISLWRIFKVASITTLSVLGILVSKDVTPPSFDGAGSKMSCHSPTATLLAEPRDLDQVHISDDHVHISEDRVHISKEQMHISKEQQFYLPQLEAIRNGSLITPQQVGIIGHNMIVLADNQHNLLAREMIMFPPCWETWPWSN